MAKEICMDCGKVFEGGAKAFFCMGCRKRRLSDAAKIRGLSKIGNEAYSKQQAERKNKKSQKIIKKLLTNSGGCGNIYSWIGHT